jgi:hypothetical protein
LEERVRIHCLLINIISSIFCASKITRQFLLKLERI